MVEVVRLKFTLDFNLLKMGTYANDFQTFFLAKNSWDCNQIRSNQIAASLNSLNRFHF